MLDMSALKGEAAMRRAGSGRGVHGLESSSSVGSYTSASPRAIRLASDGLLACGCSLYGQRTHKSALSSPSGQCARARLLPGRAV